jgi:hypothetical protein
VYMRYSPKHSEHDENEIVRLALPSILVSPCVTHFVARIVPGRSVGVSSCSVVWSGGCHRSRSRRVLEMSVPIYKHRTSARGGKGAHEGWTIKSRAPMSWWTGGG